MRTTYHGALDAARRDVVRLGEVTVEATRAALTAIQQRNTALAATVVAGDDEIDDLRRHVEQVCIELIWRQQPVAGDLRAIAAMLEIATDLERTGDYATKMAKNAIRLADMPVRPARVEANRIAEIALAMLRDAMRAFAERDGTIANAVIARDAEVDVLYRRGIEALQEEMQANSSMVPAGTVMLFVVSLLERIGDRARNIAWRTKEMLGLA
jgi:phosphate transport system protein